MSITNDFKTALQKQGIKVNDRRGKALGGNFHDRTLSAIEYAVLHWTGTANSNIHNHERHWRVTNGWGRGGYTGWIDNAGTLHLNYDFEMRTWGVGNNNTRTLNFSYEGSWSNPMNAQQKRTLLAIYKFIINDRRIPKVNNANRILGHNEFKGHTTNDCPGYNMNKWRQEVAGAKISTGSLAGATKVKDEQAKFTPNVAIKVRNAPSTKATHTGTLQKGQSIIYDTVYKGNGYRWLSYVGFTGDRLYVPYRPENDINANWGTFETKDSQIVQEKEVDKVTEAEKIYRVQTGAFSKKENAEDQAKRLKDKGFDSYIAEEDKK